MTFELSRSSDHDNFFFTLDIADSSMPLSLERRIHSWGFFTKALLDEIKTHGIALAKEEVLESCVSVIETPCGAPSS